MSRLAHGNGHRWFPIKKEELFIDQWKDIAKELEPYSDKVISSDAMEAEDYPPIVAPRDPEHPGFYRVWDGQLRTVSALHHNKEEVIAYVHPNDCLSAPQCST